MSKKIVLSLILAAAAATPALAGGHNQPQPSGLLGLVANVGTRGAIADVKANVLNNTVKADVKVGASQPSYGHGNNSQLLDLNVNAPGLAKVQADVGQQNRHGSTLLGVTANVLSGGVGNRGAW